MGCGYRRVALGADCGDCRRGLRAGPSARVVGMSARCPHRRALLTICMGYRHRRALLTPARVISPSRCRQPPHDVNNPLTVPTTRVRIDNAPSNSHPGRQRASTPKGGTRTRAGHAADTADNAHCPGARPHQGQTPGGLLRIAHHPLGVRTQRPRFKKHAPHTRAESSPCVRFRVAYSLVCDTNGDEHRKGTKRRANPPYKRRTYRGTDQPNQQNDRPAEKGAAGRQGNCARTAREAAPGDGPHRPGSRARTAQGRPAPLRTNPWAPQAAAGGAAPPGEPRPQRRPTAVASPRGAGRRCHP